MTKHPIKLAIITVNYGTPELTIRCIESVIQDQDQLPAFRLYIVDNHSPDASVEQIGDYLKTHQLEDRVTLIAAPENGGYAYGNNQALRTALAQDPLPEYFWLLNPDTQIRPGAARTLIEFLQSHPKAGLAGSRLEDEDGTPQTSAFRFHSPISEFIGTMQLGVLDKLFDQHLVPMALQDQPFQAEWLAGASVMMKKQVVKDVGLMDEVYFLYFEEVDYFVAARDKGWQAWYVPESRVHHMVGAATGISDHRKKAPRRPQYWFESRRRFFIKNFGKATALFSDLALISGYGLWRIRRFLQRKPDIDPPHFLSDLIKNSVLRRGFSLDPE